MTARIRTCRTRACVLGYEGMSPFELGVATEVFALPRPELEVDWWYSFALCARAARAAGRGRRLRHRGAARARGARARGHDHRAGQRRRARRPAGRGASTRCRAAHARGARLVSICSGAFVLAATGLLDGLTAATHWRYAALLRSRFPRVGVDPDVLYLDHGQILTSAGTAAGIDLCLHIVRRDHGADVANRVARRMVVAPHRDGGQAQFIEQPVPAAGNGDPIGTAIAHALDHLDAPLDVDALARVAHLSPRQFSRRFRATTGTSPGRWLIEQRVHASLPLLEHDERGIEALGQAVGFPSPASYRQHFREIVGVSPAAYRSRFRA